VRTQPPYGTGAAPLTEDLESDPQPKLSKWDRTLLEYMLNWAPYGGPPREEVLPLFGIAYGKLPRRVAAIIQRAHRHQPTSEEAVLLRRAATALAEMSWRIRESGTRARSAPEAGTRPRIRPVSHPPSRDAGAASCIKVAPSKDMPSRAE
jgi:hypothetical protein